MVDVLAIGAHPDDIELRVGGTIAAFVREGLQVGLLHLTRGEAGTRGSPEQRRDEALAAADVLGASSIDILDLGDGLLVDDPRSRDAVISVFRQRRPSLLLAPFDQDEHPDHVAAGSIVKAAWYLGGIQKAGHDHHAPHRARAIWFYPSHEVPRVDFVVALESNDVEAKMRAVRSYGSQFFDPNSTEPETRISAKTFLDECEARMRFAGSLIGVEHGEPFLSMGPLRVNNAAAML